MSHYLQETKNPLTGKWEMATWMDGYFGRDHYGVKFPDGTIYNPEKVKLKVKDRETP